MSDAEDERRAVAGGAGTGQPISVEDPAPEVDPHSSSGCFLSFDQIGAEAAASSARDPSEAVEAGGSDASAASGADDMTDADEAEIEAAILRLLERNEAEKATEAAAETVDLAEATDGEDVDAVPTTKETEAPSAGSEPDQAQAPAPDRETASESRLDEAIAVLPPASVPPPSGSHSPGRLDPRIENGAAPEPARPLPFLPGPPRRGAVDPRVSRTVASPREKRVGWLWLIPVMLFAGLVGLIFLPGNRDAVESAGDLIETARLPDVPELDVPVGEDIAATVSGGTGGEGRTQETTDRGREPGQTDGGTSTEGREAAPVPTDPSPGRRPTGTGRESGGTESGGNEPVGTERARSSEPASPVVEPKPTESDRTGDTPRTDSPDRTERATTSADRLSKLTEDKDSPSRPTSQKRSGTESRAQTSGTRPPAAPPPSAKAERPVQRAAPARAGVSAPATGSAGTRATARPPARLPSELAGSGRIELPERNYRWDILVGSAADLVIRVAEFDGPKLESAQRRGLALAIEAALENELDGRVVGLATPDGRTMQVHFLFSEESVETVGLERVASVSSLPAASRVEGGWYAARQGGALRPVPDIQTRFDGSDLPRGALVERYATIRGIYGDRWYLVGRDGVGLGYISAAEVTPAGAYDGPFASAEPRAPGRVVAEQAETRTTCRTIDIRMKGRAGETGTVCRHGDGRWLAQGPIRAGLGLALGPGPVGDDATLAARLVREARMTADRLPSVPAETDFIHSFNRLLADTPDGTRVTAELPDGRLLEVVVLNSRVETRRVTMQRAAEVGRLPEGLRLQPGWMEPRSTGAISPVPAERTSLLDGDVPAGAAIESLAAYAGPAGQNWTLIGRDGIAYGYLDPRNLRMITDPSQRLRFEAWRRDHGRIVRDLVEADVRCRDLELAAPRMASRAISVCQSPAGHWIVEDAGNALASAPGQVVFERLFR